MRCESLSYQSTRAAVTIVSDAFVSDSTLSGGTDSGAVVNAAATSELVTVETTSEIGVQGGLLTGRLTGQSNSVKRPVFKSGQGSSSGKINLPGAEAQSMQRHNKQRADDGISSVDPTTSKRYDLQLVANGNIRLETMSWIAALRRKYGFSDDNTAGGRNSGPPVAGKIGRTASAGKRAALLNPLLRNDETEKQ